MNVALSGRDACLAEGIHPIEDAAAGVALRDRRPRLCGRTNAARGQLHYKFSVKWCARVWRKDTMRAPL